VELEAQLRRALPLNPNFATQFIEIAGRACARVGAMDQDCHEIILLDPMPLGLRETIE
jgi:hypothetical protein